MAQLAFDLPKALDLRDRGIKQVADNNREFLEEARAVAKLRARLGPITADDVRKWCHLEPQHPNAWGAVFKDKAFVWTGQYRRSALVQGHGNMQRVWRLAGNIPRKGCGADEYCTFCGAPRLADGTIWHCYDCFYVGNDGDEE